jgi:SAM-dependent methyltransferase
MPRPTRARTGGVLGNGAPAGPDRGGATRRETPSPAYWDGILYEVADATPIHAWRAYMKRVYGRLVAAWLPVAATGLKTDLFEEAVTPHHVLGSLGPGSVGVDCSPGIAHAARKRLGREYHVVVGDLRRLPIRSRSVGRILAGSSLDHFLDSADIEIALAELARVLAPGGTLVVTFDNPHNPVVALRNWLPFSWLHRIGLVPYYVGATCNRAEAAAILSRVGLDVTGMGAVAHAPRAPAIWLAWLAERLCSPRVSRVVEWLLDRSEALDRLPTRYWTGYYLAVRAEKRNASRVD